MSCQIVPRHRFSVQTDLVFRPPLRRNFCSRKSLVKTLRWLKMLKSYSCFLCLSWRFWSSTAKEHCCFTSIILIQLKFQFYQWTRYDHHVLPYQIINRAFYSLNSRNNKSRNQLGWIFCIQLEFKFHQWTRYGHSDIPYQIITGAFYQLNFRNNKIRNQLWWIFCIPGRFSSQNVNFTNDVSINWILSYYLLSNKMKYLYNSCHFVLAWSEESIIA